MKRLAKLLIIAVMASTLFVGFGDTAEAGENGPSLEELCESAIWSWAPRCQGVITGDRSTTDPMPMIEPSGLTNEDYWRLHLRDSRIQQIISEFTDEELADFASNGIDVKDYVSCHYYIISGTC